MAGKTKENQHRENFATLEKELQSLQNFAKSFQRRNMLSLLNPFRSVKRLDLLSNSDRGALKQLGSLLNTIDHTLPQCGSIIQSLDSDVNDAESEATVRLADFRQLRVKLQDISDLIGKYEPAETQVFTPGSLRSKTSHKENRVSALHQRLTDLATVIEPFLNQDDRVTQALEEVRRFQSELYEQLEELSSSIGTENPLLGFGLEAGTLNDPLVRQDFDNRFKVGNPSAQRDLEKTVKSAKDTITAQVDLWMEDAASTIEEHARKLIEYCLKHENEVSSGIATEIIILYIFFNPQSSSDLSEKIRHFCFFKDLFSDAGDEETTVSLAELIDPIGHLCEVLEVSNPFAPKPKAFEEKQDPQNIDPDSDNAIGPPKNSLSQAPQNPNPKKLY